MLSLTATPRVFVARGATDMRKGFDGLQGLVSGILEQDPLSGHLFLFVNCRRDELKILYWDGDGLAIWYKRLERGGLWFLKVINWRVAKPECLCLAMGLAKSVGRFSKSPGGARGAWRGKGTKVA